MKDKLIFLHRNRYFIILILILFFIFWIWWIPGPRVANDFSFVSNDWLRNQFDAPRLWNERGAEGLGEYGVFILWPYPMNLLFGALAQIGFNFAVLQRISILLFIFLGSFSIWKCLSYYSNSKIAIFIGSLFYLINTYPILLIDGGQISIALAYGLFPLVFIKVSEAIHSNLAKKIIAALFVTLLGMLDIRFIYVLQILFLIKFALGSLNNKKEKIVTELRDWIITWLIIGTIVIGLNSYWLIPLISTPIDQEVFASFTSISDNFVNIGHAILMITPHWYKNVFGQISPLRWEFVLLPILVFLTPILRRKNKDLLFWLIVAICSIFLVKGGSEPLGHIYLWLHTNIPGFSLFRDSTKFFFLVALSYAVLIAISFEEITKRFLHDKKYKISFLFFVFAYLLFLVRPVFLNQMTGTFSIHPMEKEFQSLSSILERDKSFGRVFWIPSTAPLAYSDLNHPIVEASRVFNRIPFAYGVKGSYEIFNFLREASYMGEIFDIAGISYISYPYLDFRTKSLHPDNINYYYIFLNQLTNLPWIERRISESKIPLLKTKNHQDKIFIVPNTWIVFGTVDFFNEATKSAELGLANNAIIFAETKPNLSKLFSQYPEAKIVLNGKNDLDLTATFIPESKIIFPAKKLDVKPDKNGWWKNDGKDVIKWRDFLQGKFHIDNKDFDLDGGWAIREGNGELILSDSRIEKNKILMARVLESSRSGSLTFIQKGEIIGKIDTKNNKENIVRWFNVGSLSKQDELIVKSEGDINIINALAVISPNELADYKVKTTKLVDKVTSFSEENTLQGNSHITYTKINSTKYKVKVTNLSYPQTIIFSTTYHPSWKLNGQNSIPVYGFLNGFKVEKDGDYILEFELQKYIYPGLIISGLTLGTLILLLIRNSK